MAAITPPLNVLTYAVCDALTGFILYLSVIFGPWAFGTTQPWAVWTLNGLSYTLGVLRIITAIIHRCARVGQPIRCASHRSTETRQLRKLQMGRLAVFALRLATGLLLAYCLISAINARATYLPEAGRSEYHECIMWLPHSLDSTSTWAAFWNYLALASAFWATRSWLLDVSCPQQGLNPPGAENFDQLSSLPQRLRGLLWVLSVNGGLLAMESIIQRSAGSPKLLFFIQPQLHRTALSQFGPFAYRANAAEYFNLLWPVCFGFWYALREANTGRKINWLLGCALVMAACPMISTSRGGAIISGGLMIATIFLVIRVESQRCLATASLTRPSFRRELALFLIGAAVLGVALGWNQLAPRLQHWQQGYAGREEIYRVARQIAADFPVFGTGPGTYTAVSELYRPDPARFWPAQVHNDWLETRITFGWMGTGLLLASLSLLIPCALTARDYVGSRLPGMAWLALLGGLFHARFDFPFQVYSILHLFVVLSALISALRITPGIRIEAE